MADPVTLALLSNPDLIKAAVPAAQQASYTWSIIIGIVIIVIIIAIVIIVVVGKGKKREKSANKGSGKNTPGKNTPDKGKNGVRAAPRTDTGTPTKRERKGK